MEKKTKYSCSCSFGKDSAATVILAHIHNEPLDLILFSEVMFDENISGEYPEHIEFIYKCKKVFEGWGYEVKILHSDKTYKDCFNHIVTNAKKRPQNNGKKKGFVIPGKCDVQAECKLKPIREFFKSEADTHFIQYIGIAKDEPDRLKRLDNVSKISLLEKYGYTEADAYNLCKEYDLLSPIYSFSKRNGCWFCPNMRLAQKRHIYINHRNLWNKLKDMEKEPNVISNKAFHDISTDELETKFKAHCYKLF